MKMYRFDLKLGWGKIVCKPRSPFVQSMFDRSATSMASSELSGSSSTLMAPSFDESNIMGLPSFLGFGANAPVIAEMSITPSSINPVGTARHGAVHSHRDTTSTPCKFTMFQRFSFTLFFKVTVTEIMSPFWITGVFENWTGEPAR